MRKLPLVLISLFFTSCQFARFLCDPVVIGDIEEVVEEAVDIECPPTHRPMPSPLGEVYPPYRLK